MKFKLVENSFRRNSKWNDNIDRNTTLPKSNSSKSSNIPSNLLIFDNTKIDYIYDGTNPIWDGSKLNKRSVPPEDCTKIKNILIKNTVADITPAAFFGLENLERVLFEDGRKNPLGIHEWAFGECKNLKSIEFPNNLLAIGEAAFYGCVSLKNIILPELVIIVDTYAFKYCTQLGTVAIANNNISLNNDIFEFSPNVKILCNKNSNAESYAHINNIPVVPTNY